MDTKRQKKGGNVYYTPEINVNADSNLEMSQTDMETISVFQQSIDAENTEVIEAYNKAKASGSVVSDIEATKVVESLNEPLPEDVLST
jgi:hypothetical protein